MSYTVKKGNVFSQKGIVFSLSYKVSNELRYTFKVKNVEFVVWSWSELEYCYHFLVPFHKSICFQMCISPSKLPVKAEIKSENQTEILTQLVQGVDVSEYLTHNENINQPPTDDNISGHAYDSNGDTIVVPNDGHKSDSYGYI